jgi:hypothetical protein
MNEFPSSGGWQKFPEIFDGVVLKCILFLAPIAVKILF